MATATAMAMAMATVMEATITLMKNHREFGGIHLLGLKSKFI
jgi:hypothetical protein